MSRSVQQRFHLKVFDVLKVKVVVLTLKMVSSSSCCGVCRVACFHGILKRMASRSIHPRPGYRPLSTWATSQGFSRTRRGVTDILCGDRHTVRMGSFKLFITIIGLTSTRRPTSDALLQVQMNFRCDDKSGNLPKKSNKQTDARRNDRQPYLWRTRKLGGFFPRLRTKSFGIKRLFPAADSLES